LADDGSEDKYQEGRHRNRWLRVRGWMLGIRARTRMPPAVSRLYPCVPQSVSMESGHGLLAGHGLLVKFE
jgi:hypothetical protein